MYTFILIKERKVTKVTAMGQRGKVSDGIELSMLLTDIDIDEFIQGHCYEFFFQRKINDI